MSVWTSAPPARVHSQIGVLDGPFSPAPNAPVPLRQRLEMLHVVLRETSEVLVEIDSGADPQRMLESAVPPVLSANGLSTTLDEVDNRLNELTTTASDILNRLQILQSHLTRSL